MQRIAKVLQKYFKSIVKVLQEYCKSIAKVSSIVKIAKIAPSASIVYQFWYFFFAATQHLTMKAYKAITFSESAGRQLSETNQL